jgi:hypothetical protein
VKQPIVQFLAGDIIHPPPAQVLCALYEKNPLQGEIVAVTDDGGLNEYLVVRVSGLSEPVIVPARMACHATSRTTGTDGRSRDGLKPPPQFETVPKMT